MINVRYSLPILLAVTAGILVGRMVDNVLWSALPIVLAFTIAFTGPRMRGLMVPFLFFGMGWLSISLSMPQSDGGELREGMGYVQGIVSESVSTTSGERSRLNVQRIDYADSISSESIECSGVSLLLFSPAGRMLRVGDVVGINAILRSPDRAGSPDLKLVAISRHEPTVYRRISSLAAWSADIRHSLSSKIDETRLSHGTRTLLKALLLGERQAIPKEMRERFSDAGVSHMLAVSGMHVGIITLIFMALTKPLHLIRGGYRARYFVCAVAVWLFVILTGFSYSSVRSAVMLTFGMTAIVTARNRDPFSAVTLAAAVILICSPMSLWDAGLQLSYVCVAALTLFAERLNPLNQVEHPRSHRIASIALSSLVATGATWTLTAYYFGTIPTHFLTANILTLPFLPIYLSLSLLYLFFAAFGIEWGWFCAVLDYFPARLKDLLDYLYGDAIHIEIEGVYVLMWLIGLALLAVSLHVKGRNKDVGTALNMSRPTLHLPTFTTACLLLTATLLLC